MESGELPSEASMVTVFMKGILNKDLLIGKTFIIGDDTKWESWEKMQLYFLLVIQDMAPHQKLTRDTSQVTTGGGHGG